MKKLFYELIRVSIGTGVCLSRTPSVAEWQTLYDMALKQSLVGVCFAGVQKTLSSSPLKGEDWNMPEALYLRWMGLAAKIQQRNEVVNRQCVEVQRMLAEAGFKSSILKGQGIASLYRLQNCGESSRAGSDPAREKTVENLANLRQSGDIDIWVDGGMEKALEWCHEKYGKVEFDYINAHVPVFDNTEVELHWRAQAMTNLFANKKLQEWLKSPQVQSAMLGGRSWLEVSGERLEITTPTAEFNAFYILLHCYHHMFESGLGLRQLMDYYFVLVAYAERKLPKIDRELDVNALFDQFGMKRFAKGVMWIMGHVFGLEREYMLCEPDEREGRFLLKEVMQNGNFGHHDERIKKVVSGKMSELWRNVQHNWHLASHYPSEFLWQPVWLAYHYFWKRNLKLFTR